MWNELNLDENRKAVLAVTKSHANRGVIMVVGLPGFLSEEQRQWYANREAEKARLEALWQGQRRRSVTASASPTIIFIEVIVATR